MRHRLALLTALFALATPLAARANTMDFTMTTTASGFVNGVAFDLDQLTIWASYDIADVFHFGALSVVHATLTYTIANVGTFTDIGLPDYIVANGVGIGAGSQNHLDLLDSANIAFAGYNLETEFGLIVGTGISPVPGHTHHSGAKADTTAGFFELDSTSPVTITFAFTPATPPPVPPAVTPEPSSFLLLGTGLLGLSSTAVRKLRKV